MKAIATSFASMADLRAFQAAKARGLSDQQAFKVGDNGIGCWGDVTAQTSLPMCALPPEIMALRWGSKGGARRKRVVIQTNGKSVTCILADCMPHVSNITNGAGIDLNPAAIATLGLPTECRQLVTWDWADGDLAPA